jgi:hypothetical protein
MAEPDKRPVTLEELLVSSLAQTDALAKLLIERADYARGIYAEDFRGARDLSKTSEPNIAVNIAVATLTNGLIRRCHLSLTAWRGTRRNSTRCLETAALPRQPHCLNTMRDFSNDLAF